MMKITVKRVALRQTYTIGKLYVDGNYYCDTLEDTVRKLDSIDDKVYGMTAIPYGTYKVIVNYSNRFKRHLPRLLNVPFFEGILIHPGNTAEDTSGCILVGRNLEKGKVLKSRATFEPLYESIVEALKHGETVTISITS